MDIPSRRTALRLFGAPTLALLAASAMAAVTAGPAAAGEPPPGADAGPPYSFVTELMGLPGTAEPLKNQAVIDKSLHGYQFRSGQQNGHLVVTLVAGGIRFADKNTETWKKLAAGCDRQKAAAGVAAVCNVPKSVTENAPMLVEIWPRLGNDFTDTSALPASFAVTVLGDRGKDTALFGAGDDFFNGFTGNDVVRGGAGNDWIRSGVGNDTVNGGPGDDDVVAKEGHDAVRGGSGNDRLWGGDGDDKLSGGAGMDYQLCGNGHDNVVLDRDEHKFSNCETMQYR